MNKATEGKGTFEFLSTHPSGDTRIEQLTELMPAVTPLYFAAKNIDESNQPSQKSKKQ
jgi:predicted Zn-dependent protease